MERRLVWSEDGKRPGWACTLCQWICTMPDLLTTSEGKSAYDRLALVKFAEHDCTKYASRANPSERQGFAEQARLLIMRGFKPKDAVEIRLREISFEHRDSPKLIAQARVDAEDFLRRVKAGLI